MSTSDIAPCCFLPWDSTFFGFRVARVSSVRLDAGHAAHALDWCAAENIRCLYWLVDAADTETVRVAEDAGFRLVDIRLTLERPLADWPARPGGMANIRRATPEDLPALEAIARVSHTDSRFYADPHFPRERCAALYATWIAQNCRAARGVVFVAEWQGRPAGYLACDVDDAGKGRIGLFAVAEAGQGHGLGQRLIAAALGWCVHQGAAQVQVVTQGRNVRAQRSYQRAEFRTAAVQLWYHRWFAEKGDSSQL